MTANKITLEQADRRNQASLSGLKKSASELQALLRVSGDGALGSRLDGVLDRLEQLSESSNPQLSEISKAAHEISRLAISLTDAAFARRMASLEAKLDSIPVEREQ